MYVLSAAGWTDGGLADKSTLRFWEYQSRHITGTSLVDVSSRVSWSRQLDATEAETASNPTNVFASIFWEPILEPYVACQPTNQNVLVGQPATISAAIGGIPQPVYQWYKGTAPVANGTGYTLVIPNAQAGDAGSYTLRATNDLGFVVTSAAVLNVTAATPPSLGAPVRLDDGNVRLSLSGIAGQPYRLWGSGDLALTPVTSAWTLLDSGSFGAAPVVFTDSVATNSARRFYIITVP